jgi:MFS family permease
MRAIGFAALSFGAVIALSATLGMSYRSDASPLDEPTATASIPGAASAPDSSTPADQPTAPTAPTAEESTTPAATDDPSSPAADDSSSPSPTDDAAPTADPTADPTSEPLADQAPSARGFSLFAQDLYSAVSYSFAPGQVTVDIYTGSPVAGTTSVWEEVPGSGFVEQTGNVCTWSDFYYIECRIALAHSGAAGATDQSVGFWRILSETDDGTVLDDHYIDVPARASAAPSLTVGAHLTISGVGSRVGDTVHVYRTDAGHEAEVACTTTPVVEVEGGWSCTTGAPGDFGTHSYQAAEEDVDSCPTGQAPLDCTAYGAGAISLLSPESSYSSPIGWSFTQSNSVDVHWTLADDADSGNIVYTPADNDGSDLGAGAPTCHVSTQIPVASCALQFAQDPGFGFWHLSALQTAGTETVHQTDTYVYIPPAPTLDEFYSGEGTEIDGTGIVGDGIRVLNDSGDVVCETTVESDDSEAGTGYWNCYPGEVDLSGDFTAVQVDAGDCAVDGFDCDADLPVTPGGISAASAPLSYEPDVTTDFRPAGVVVTARPGTGSTGTAVQFYRLQQGDDYYGGTYFSFENFQEDSWCPQQSTDEESFLAGDNVCGLTQLTPGSYEAYAYQDGSGGTVDEWFVVPNTPTISTAAVKSNHAVLLTGTGDAGDAVHVIVDGSAAACDTTVAANGSWNCTVPALGKGAHSFRAYAEDIGAGDPSAAENDYGVTYTTGGISAGSNVGTVTIATGFPPTTLATLATWFFTVTGVDLNNVHPGDTFTVTGNGLPPGSTVSGELHSKAISIGSAVVQPDGTFSLPVTVPADFPAGAHQLVMTLTPAGSAPVESAQPLTVLPAEADTASGGSDDPTATDDNSSPIGGAEEPGIDHHGPNSNILTHGLNSIADVLAHPAKVPAAIEIGLVLLIFAVLPGHLLNATLAEQYERFTKRRQRRTRAPGRWARLVAFLHRAPFVAGLALTTITALLFGFADPRFGFSLASLRLFLGLAIALAVVSYLTNAVVGRIMRGRWKVDVEVSLRPLGLILTVVGVVVSRLLDFSPGFLIGLVLGLVISEKHLAKQAWRAVLLRSSILLGLALLAWLAFSLFDAKQEGGTFASELAVETLVAITTEAVVGLLVELLPLKLLEGEKLYEKSKVLWGALYLLAVFIFVVAVVPWEGNWAELGASLWAWIGIVVGFGIVATGVYLYFRIRTHEEHELHENADESVGGLVPISSEDD